MRISLPRRVGPSDGRPAARGTPAALADAGLRPAQGAILVLLLIAHLLAVAAWLRAPLRIERRGAWPIATRLRLETDPRPLPAPAPAMPWPRPEAVPVPIPALPTIRQQAPTTAAPATDTPCPVGSPAPDHPAVIPGCPTTPPSPLPALQGLWGFDPLGRPVPLAPPPGPAEAARAQALADRQLRDLEDRYGNAKPPPEAWATDRLPLIPTEKWQQKEEEIRQTIGY